MPNNNNVLQIHVKLDDICPNGGICKLPQNDCNRIHFMHYSIVCQEFNCSDAHCSLFHLHYQRMTGRLLSFFLYLHNNFSCKIQQCPPLSEYYIPSDRFIFQYLKYYIHPPIPGMDINDHHTWRKIIDSYNKYYFDYEQQIVSDKYAQNGSYLTLWHTENSVNARHEGSWKIVINFDRQFFVKRSCFNWLDAGKCAFSYYRRSFCPHFHLELRCRTCSIIFPLNVFVSYFSGIDMSQCVGIAENATSTNVNAINFM